MISDIGIREIIAVDVSGATLSGTYHKPASGRKNPDNIGLIFLNGGYRPRSGEGDTGVYWADSLAASGYPCFRFDLPGYGDSAGEVPEKLFDWLHLVNTGAYGEVVANLVRAVVKRFHLSGAVIVGHCAGATTAIYATAGNADVRGLVLLDPSFQCERESTKVRLQLREWITRNRIARLFSKAYDRLLYVDRLLVSKRLPENANTQAIRCCEQILAAEVPILILKAPALNIRLGQFDYLDYLRSVSGKDSCLTVALIEETNHSFAKGSGKVRVRERIEGWLATGFPGANNRVNSWIRPYALR